MNWQLFNGDCVAGMRVDNDSIAAMAGCTITDPPFSEDTHAPALIRKRRDGGKARDVISFAAATDTLILDASAEIVRLTKRWIIVFGDEGSLPKWRAALESNGAEWIRLGIWVKSDAAPQMTGDRPGQGHELFAVLHAPRAAGRTRWNGGGRHARYTGPAQESGVTRVHPTQKPLWLMSAIVRDFTDPGELVCDPFAGSGSTGVAAVQEGRRFVGWELDAAHCASARARLAAAREQPELFGGAPAAPKQLSMIGGKP